MKILGIGLRKNATITSIENAVLKTQCRDFHAISTLSRKIGFAALQEYAAANRLKVLGQDDDKINAIETVTQSRQINTRFSTGSIAEACALVACKNGEIIAPRQISDDRLASAAIAQEIAPKNAKELKS